MSNMTDAQLWNAILSFFYREPGEHTPDQIFNWISRTYHKEVLYTDVLWTLRLMEHRDKLKSHVSETKASNKPVFSLA